ncbi:transmembrane protein 238-like [Polypterus senegalus]|nr:transmembrane protein 238-like [Polypterus senegalus]
MATKCMSRCFALFWLGIGFDVVGFILVLIGIFANVQYDGRFFGDFLIYTGAILIFLSLIWWILWYTGNIEVSLEELGKDPSAKKSRFAQWARKVSERLSKRGLKTLEEAAERMSIGRKEPVQGAVSAGSPSRVTWEVPNGYVYENSCMDMSTENEKTLELSTLKRTAGNGAPVGERLV